MKQGQTLYLFHDDKPLAVDREQIVTMIGVDANRTTILLTNGRDIIISKPYEVMLSLCGLRREAEEAGQIEPVETFEQEPIPGPSPSPEPEPS